MPMPNPLPPPSWREPPPPPPNEKPPLRPPPPECPPEKPPEERPPPEKPPRRASSARKASPAPAAARPSHGAPSCSQTSKTRPANAKSLRTQGVARAHARKAKVEFPRCPYCISSDRPPSQPQRETQLRSVDDLGGAASHHSEPTGRVTTPAAEAPPTRQASLPFTPLSRRLPGWRSRPRRRRWRGPSVRRRRSRSSWPCSGSPQGPPSMPRPGR